MKKAFKAPKLIGLLALVLGLMAFSAAAAQAEPGAYWEVGGTKIEGTSTLLPIINAEKDSNHNTLITHVNGNLVEILCNTIKFAGAKLHTLGRATGKIHYNECETLVNSVALARCVPHSPGAPNGLIETNALKGLIKLHESSPGVKKDLVQLLPETGTEFVNLKLGSGLCAIGNEFPITTTVGAFIKDCTEEGLVNKVKHLFEEGPLTELLFGGNASTIVGSAWAFLEGAPHAGMVWSGHPA